ncbi:MAG: response regulator [Proteobacteria bacterium]|nr:response regulator [Pseudomonadota bacterium]
MADILIVEDDPLVRHAFLTLLKAEGHDVVAVPSAEAAVKSAGQRAPALVLLDVGLPGTDGIECAGLLRQLKLQAPIIFLTAHGGPEFVARAIRHDPYAYLVKPIVGGQLIPLVHTALHAAEVGRAREDKLLGALADSREISAAVGMLAERHRWSIDEAFSALRVMARSESRRVIDVANEVIARLR